MSRVGTPLSPQRRRFLQDSARAAGGCVAAGSLLAWHCLERGQRILSLNGRTVANLEANEGIDSFLDANDTVDFETPCASPINRKPLRSPKISSQSKVAVLHSGKIVTARMGKKSA